MAGGELKNNFNQENDKKITNNNKRMMTKLDIKINLCMMKLKKKFNERSKTKYIAFKTIRTKFDSINKWAYFLLLLLNSNMFFWREEREKRGEENAPLEPNRCFDDGTCRITVKGVARHFQVPTSSLKTTYEDWTTLHMLPTR